MNLNWIKNGFHQEGYFEPKMFDAGQGNIETNRGKIILLAYRLRSSFAILPENVNDVITKEDLMAYVWKDIIVTEESLTKAVSDPGRFIKNNQLDDVGITMIRKTGYQLNIDLKKKRSALLSDTGSFAAGVIGYTVLFYAILVILIRAY